MARQTVVKKQGPRGPMTAEHKKKIGLALKRKWKARKIERVTPLDLALSQPKMNIELTGFNSSRSTTLNQILSDLDDLTQGITQLHEKLHDLVGY